MTTPARLRIAFVVDVCDDSKSGGPRAAQRFIAELARHHEVRVVTTGRPQPGRVVLPGFYFPLAGRIMRSMDFVFAWPRTQPLEQLFREVDVVHVQLPFLLGWRAVRCANRLGVPVVGGCHVQPENFLYNVGLRSARLADRLNRWLMSGFYNRCAAVVCPSAFAAAQLQQYGLRPPSFVISNGVPPQFRPWPDRPPRGGAADFVVLMVGRWGREKRPDLLVRAAALSRYRARLRLVLVGKGPLAARLRCLGRRLPRPPELAAVSDAELLRLYNTADLLVHASEVELEGLSVLEALACGLPALIAAAAASAAKQFAVDERLLFAPGDPQALAARLDFWIEHPAELRAAGERALQLAQRHALADCARQLAEVYRACVSRRSAAAGGPGTGAGGGS